MSKIIIGSRRLLTIYDANNDKRIETFNISNVEDDLLNYVYFGNYKNYILYLLSRGAVVHDVEPPELYLKTQYVLVPVYEIPRIKVGLNVRFKKTIGKRLQNVHSNL